ncbi:DUF659 domain-containing protein [Aphis craccivora]|uniref:DUF659 domain-containing protein n=1 Tax=Aphis craccivora TaxID=307492 RepID=A0A6G0VMA4_APHCR|nr:DUF659 domain-containing protein [Aphis craccivora]
MSKVQSSVRKYVAEFGENFFASDGGILFCKVCEIKVNSAKRFTVTQHLKTDKHIRAVNRKIENKSKSQKTYVNECYEDTMNNIRNQVKGKKIWVSIDETTDATGRYIANVVIGTLEIDKPGKIFLLSCDVLEKANHSTNSNLFDKALFSLWPSGIQHDDVLLFVTDAAPYMKAPARVELFKKEAPDVPLPPSPISALQHLSAEDAISIGKVKKIMLEENILEADLVFIYSNYGILKTTIKSLEKQCLPLADSICYILF